MSIHPNYFPVLAVVAFGQRVEQANRLMMLELVRLWKENRYGKESK